MRVAEREKATRRDATRSLTDFFDALRPFAYVLSAVATLAFVPAIRGYRKAVQAEVWRDMAEERIRDLERWQRTATTKLAEIEAILIRIERSVTR